MRLRNVKNAKELVNSNKYVITEPESYKGKYNKLFANKKPIHIEIGMGKGNFIIDMALKHPDINFIGIERYESVLVRALEKLNDKEIPNLRFICMDAIKIGDVFDHEVDCIYLNFSDPWPKKRHAKRRLTSSVFLPLYDMVFKGDCLIVQKTDNVSLFESSIVSLSTYGYVIEDISLDLASTDIENSLTEYEAKFMSQGIKINYLVARKKKNLKNIV